MATAKKSAQVLDGSDIADLVHNKQVFSKFIDEKFLQLDQDHDGRLSVKELQPAVAEIGVALGLPAQGSSDSDHIYSEVLSEFTHGKQEDVSKSEFQEVLSDILLGMAAGLKRDPIVILRIDGKDLSEFVNSSRFVPEAVAIFSQIEAGENESLRNCITKALKKLTVDHGMPPASDSWVFNEIIEPALQAHTALLNKTPPISKESFLGTLKKVAESIADHLREQPVIVAHSGNTFDGSGVKRLLSNKFETDKVLASAWKSLTKDRNGRFSREYLRVALDEIAPAAGLPPFGAVNQMDELVKEVFKMVNADDGSSLQEEEFKLVMREILGSIMLQLEGNPISVFSNSVVNESDTSSSTLFPALHQSE